VINYSTFFISFYSQGVTDTLFPSRVQHNMSAQTEVVGIDAFKFLATHSDGSLPSGFKNKVRTSLKMGQAVSVDLSMCTRRYMGFERFVVHWTPLKGEDGNVAWVVATIGSTD
jgi:phototropin